MWFVTVPHPLLSPHAFTPASRYVHRCIVDGAGSAPVAFVYIGACRLHACELLNLSQ